MENNKYLIFSLIILILVSGCVKTPLNEESCNDITCNTIASLKDVNIEKLEIYHFHPTNQCYSCKTVGAYAEETVNTYFADELKSGKIVFGHINAQLPENEELAKKYGITGSSLWLGVYDKNGFHPEQNTNVWYKINDKEDYMNYLKGIIEKRLAGDLS